MKTRISFLICLCFLILQIPKAVFASRDIVLPFVVSYNADEINYRASAMRIDAPKWGDIYSVEFDVELPVATANAKYTLHFNWETTDLSGTRVSGVSHLSEIIAKNENSQYVWNFSSNNGASAIVADNRLESGVLYHFEIVVDLNEKKHSWFVSKEDGSKVVEGEDYAFKDEPTGDLNILVCGDLRWGGRWLISESDTTGVWRSDSKPQNIVITRNKAFVVGSPTVSCEGNMLTAQVTAYHNILDFADSPVIVLCVYDSDGVLLDISSSKLEFNSRAELVCEGQKLKTTLDIKPFDGMTVQAFVIGGLNNRIACVDMTEEIY